MCSHYSLSLPSNNAWLLHPGLSWLKWTKLAYLPSSSRFPSLFDQMAVGTPTTGLTATVYTLNNIQLSKHTEISTFSFSYSPNLRYAICILKKKTRIRGMRNASVKPKPEFEPEIIQKAPIFPNSKGVFFQRSLEKSVIGGNLLSSFCFFQKQVAQDFY